MYHIITPNINKLISTYITGSTDTCKYVLVLDNSLIILYDELSCFKCISKYIDNLNNVIEDDHDHHYVYIHSDGGNIHITIKYWGNMKYYCKMWRFNKKHNIIKYTTQNDAELVGFFMNNL
jgi:hypothetical protein